MDAAAVGSRDQHTDAVLGAVAADIPQLLDQGIRIASGEEAGAAVHHAQHQRHLLAGSQIAGPVAAKRLQQPAAFLDLGIHFLQHLFILAVLTGHSQIRRVPGIFKCLQRAGVRIRQVELDLLRAVRLHTLHEHPAHKFALAAAGHAVYHGTARAAQADTQGLVLPVVQVVVAAHLHLHLLCGGLTGHGAVHHFQRLCPDEMLLQLFILCRLTDLLQDGCDLLEVRRLRMHGRSCRQNHASLLIQQAHGVIPWRLILCFGQIRRTGIAGLAQFKDLIHAHLQIEASGCCKGCCIRAFQHCLTILLILHLQTDPVAGIAADLLIHHTVRFLRCQDQVHAQAASDTGDPDQLLHKVALLMTQLCKLITDNDQVRHRLCHASLPVKLLILIDIHCIELQLPGRLLEDLLSVLQFAFNGKKAAAQFVAIQVCDGACQMRQAAEYIRHAAALEVD